MQLGVIGTGHVGLVSCVTLASLGHEVVGTDSDEHKIELLSKGVAPFFEPGLQELLERQTQLGRVHFTSDPARAIGEARAVFVCVGTPPRAGGEANLIAVEQAARTFAEHATGRALLVEKSTVPTGTAERLGRMLRMSARGRDSELEIVANPEFLREGKAIDDSLKPDRILVGAESEWAFETMRQIYEPLIHSGCPLIETDIATAELAKHACNAFLALKISFANALARLCERAGADVVGVANVMGSDPRIGRDFLDAGIGYGGSCFPKDLRAFERLADSVGYKFPLLDETARINEEALQAAADKVREALWNLEGKRIGFLGLAFKPDTDDIRFSPALGLARYLLGHGATVVGYDPRAAQAATNEIPELVVATDAYEAARGADCLVVCTAWPEFTMLDLARLKEAMASPVIVDGRNLFDPDEMRALGFTYYPTGRPPIIH